MKPENIWAYSLLEDVKKDAIRKAGEEKPAVQVYAAIQQILQLNRLARREGLLALEEVLDDSAGELQPELAGLSVLPVGLDYIICGMDFDLTAEMLAAHYWAKNPQGMEALAVYICIRGLVEIQNGEYCKYSPYNLELLLKSFLTEECKAGYESYRAEKEPGPMEKLLEYKESKLTTRGSLLRNALEETLAHVPDRIIKEAIWKMGEKQDLLVWIVIGLSKAGRKRLLSCMSEIRVGSICEDIEYKEYITPPMVRQADIENAFACLIDTIEAISGEK